MSLRFGFLPCDLPLSLSFFFFCLLLIGLWEASRRAEPSWIYALPACQQHGKFPRVSVCSSLSSRYFLASAPLPAATFQWAHVLQHELPCSRPSSTIHVPEGAIRLTCPITFSSAKGNMLMPQPLHGKQSSAEQMCVRSCVCSFYKLKTKFSSHMMKMPVIYGPQSSVYCTLLAPLRLSVGPSTPFDVSALHHSDLHLSLPTHPVCFWLFPHLWIFCFFPSHLTMYRIYTQDVFFFGSFFTFPTVVVIFYSNVHLLFVSFVCHACLYEIHILYCICDWVCNG